LGRKVNRGNKFPPSEHFLKSVSGSNLASGGVELYKRGPAKDGGKGKEHKLSVEGSLQKTGQAERY